MYSLTAFSQCADMMATIPVISSLFDTSNHICFPHAQNHLRSGSDSLRLGGFRGAGTGHEDGGATELFVSTDVVMRHEMKGHSRGVNWVAFHPTLSLVVSAADDRSIILWRISGKCSLFVVSLHRHP